jgi:hypothetical protein
MRLSHLPHKAVVRLVNSDYCGSRAITFLVYRIALRVTSGRRPPRRSMSLFPQVRQPLRRAAPGDAYSFAGVRFSKKEIDRT